MSINEPDYAGIIEAAVSNALRNELDPIRNDVAALASKVDRITDEQSKQHTATVDTVNKTTRAVYDEVSSIREAVTTAGTKADNANATAATVAQAVEKITTEQAEHRARTEQMIEALKVMNGNVQSVTQRIDSVEAGVGERIDAVNAETARVIGDVAANIGNVHTGMVEELGNVRGELVERIDGISSNLPQEIADLREAATEAATERAKVEADLAKIETEREKVEEEKSNAERAVALMSRLSDHEIERAAAEQQMKERRKALAREMEAEEAEQNDRFDMQQHFLTRAINRYYPELDEKLSALTEEADAEDE